MTTPVLRYSFPPRSPDPSGALAGGRLSHLTQLVGSALSGPDLGVVFAANIVPMIAFMLGGGAIADRLGRRPVMLAADVARCAAQGVLATALQAGHPRLWLFVAAALVVGSGNAFFQPALAGLPVQLAPRDRLGDANALLAAAQVAGPALAGILITATSPAVVIAVDAQQRIPAQALSRVSAFNMVGAFAFGPVAFAAAGPVPVVVGARALLGFGAAWAAFGTIVVFTVPSVRRVTWLDDSPQDQQAAMRQTRPPGPTEGNSAPPE